MTIQYQIIAALAIVLALGSWGGYQTIRKNQVQTEYADFRREVAKAAQAAAEQSLQKTIADEKRKEESDAENLRLRADLAATTRRLRDARASVSFVPAPAANAPDPAIACFDRSQLDGALRKLDSDVQGLIDEGAAALIDLDTAKRWAAGR